VTDIQTGARLLTEARLKHQRIAELPEAIRPKTPEEAYACQDAVVARLLEHYGGRVIGYKIACTNKIAQELLRVDRPFHGKLLSSFCFDSPSRVKADSFFMRVIEAEFAFLMARDLAPCPQPFSRDEVSAAVEGVLPGIEIVDSRFHEWTSAGIESLLADNDCHGAWVRGALAPNWRAIDLAEQEVRLSANGKVVQTGSGAAVLGHPLNALHWLANTLREQGETLKAGQYVTTGVTTDIYMAHQGDQILADFGQTGTVELTFE